MLLLAEQDDLIFLDDGDFYRLVMKMPKAKMIKVWDKSKYESYETFAEVMGKWFPDVFFYKEPKPLSGELSKLLENV